MSTAATVGAMRRHRGSSQLPYCANIRAFGATGDGVANDTTAFEALVTHCAATGALGYLPAGTYLVDPSTRTFSGSKPFTIYGDGAATVLKNRNTASAFIGWTGANGAAFERMVIDGAFTGSPSTPSSGGVLVLVNSSNNVVRDVAFRNLWRVALMIYNDHQTTLTNVYSGHVVERVTVTGPANKIDNTGPSAIVIADVDDSIIKDCSISNVGQYGFEFKNDCNDCLISGCSAVDSYRPFYFGGDGTHTELMYVKDSTIEDCEVTDSAEPLWLGLASGNTVDGFTSTTTSGGPVPNRAICSISEGSTGNTVTGLHIVNRKGRAVDIRAASTNNEVEYSLEDGAVTTNKSYISADSTGSSITEV